MKLDDACVNQKLQIAAIHKKRKINKKNRLTKLNELIFHQNQSLSTCISNWFNVKVQRGMLTTNIYMLKRLVIFI